MQEKNGNNSKANVERVCVVPAPALLFGRDIKLHFAPSSNKYSNIFQIIITRKKKLTNDLRA